MDDLLTTDACTLPTAERPLRLAELDALLARTREVRRRGLSLRLELAGEPGLLEVARGLTAREAACCSFFAFDVSGSDDAFTLSVTVPLEHRGMLDALADRAEELSA